ncbi:MAG: hypothetical protein NTZ35_00625 [Ignavibacteriales bacterium]|nr:hypothetical protein [Ignavibacteriales bacterium]
MLIRDYFQPPIPTRQEASMAYKVFLEDFGRWYSTKGGPRPFEEASPYYVQIGYDGLSVEGARAPLAPADFGKEFSRLRAATCATAMIDQDMYQLFIWKQIYADFRNRFVFPKLENNMPPINFIDETILDDRELVGFMKCHYLLVFHWLKDQTGNGSVLTRRLYGQLREDNKGHEGLRGILWKRIFADYL